MKKFMIAAAAMAACVSNVAQAEEPKLAIANINFDLSKATPVLAKRLTQEERPNENFRVASSERDETPQHIRMIKAPVYRDKRCLGIGINANGDGEVAAGVRAGRKLYTPQ